MDKHELVAAIKTAASDLGRTPTKAEFVNATGITHYQVTSLFGSFTVLVKAAGLDAYQDRAKAKRITNEVFERDIEEHIQAYEPAARAGKRDWPTIATISDIHWPFQNDRVVNRFIEYVGDEKPAHVILNGDAWDRYSHGRFPRSHNLFTPREEDQLSRKLNQEFWAKVKAASPGSQCTQMLGNHEVRPMKQVLENYPQAEDWIKEALRRDFTFDGVTTFFDPRQEFVIDGDIVVHHGFRSQLGAHRDYALMNAICGHTHKGGVVFRQIRGQTLWELNSGLAGDPEAKGLTYTPQRITVWTPGFGALNKYGPQFVSV